MVAVGDVTLIRYARHDAKAFLQAFRKFICGALDRRSVDAEADVGLFFPFVTGIVHVLHHFKGERRRFRIGVGSAGHVFHALVKSRISEGDGGITAVEQAVNGLAFFSAAPAPYCQRIGAASEKEFLSGGCDGT